MSNFKEKKEKYLERLCTNMETISGLLQSGNMEVANVLLAPSDERELRRADAMLTFALDMNDLMDALFCGNVEDIPFEENNVIQYVVKTINSTLDENNQNELPDFNTIIEGSSEGEIAAKFYYQLIVGTVPDEIPALQYIEKETGADLRDENDVQEIKNAIEKLRGNAEAKLPFSQVGVEEYSDKDLDSIEDFVQHFHSLCEKGIKKDDVFEDLFKLFIKKLMGEEDDPRWS